MPRYDYRCADCEQEFELVQSFSEAGKGECPECSGAGQRVFHAVPVIYKGTGFYTTDYGRPKPPVESAKTETSDSSKSSSDSKPSPDSSSSTSSSSPSGGSSSSGSSGSSAESTPAKATSDSGSSS